MSTKVLKRTLVIELAAMTALAAMAVTICAVEIGHFGLSWDALNHHIYLGMFAESPRWDFDVAAAGSQSYQYPYLYWPVYRLSRIVGHGAHFGAVWAAFQTICVIPPLWLVVYRLLPDGSASNGFWLPRLERFVACVLALLCLPVLAALGTTSNDLLASVPLLWGLVFAVGFPGNNRAAVAAGALWGVACAFKFSNVIFFVVPLIAWWRPDATRLPIGLGVGIGVAVVSGFLLAYAPWGWQLWREMGNPFYPYFQALFVAN